MFYPAVVGRATLILDTNNKNRLSLYIQFYIFEKLGEKVKPNEILFSVRLSILAK